MGRGAKTVPCFYPTPRHLQPSFLPPLPCSVVPPRLPQWCMALASLLLLIRLVSPLAALTHRLPTSLSSPAAHWSGTSLPPPLSHFLDLHARLLLRPPLPAPLAPRPHQPRRQHPPSPSRGCCLCPPRWQMPNHPFLLGGPPTLTSLPRAGYQLRRLRLVLLATPLHGLIRRQDRRGRRRERLWLLGSEGLQLPPTTRSLPLPSPKWLWLLSRLLCCRCPFTPQPPLTPANQRYSSPLKRSNFSASPLRSLSLLELPRGGLHLMWSGRI